MQTRGVLAVIAGVLASCLEIPEADLAGPRVVAATLVRPRTVEVPVLPVLELHLSEPIDPGSVHRGTIAVVPWETVGTCEVSPICEEGSCERGRCQIDPLSETDRRRFDRGEGVDGEPLRFEWDDSPRGENSVVRVIPVRPLRPHSRHTWLVGAAVRDLSGAPLSNGSGRASRWHRDFVTAREGSSGPEARLIRPPAGARNVPTNVVTVETRFELPVRPSTADTLILEEEHGASTELVRPEPCEGWVPGLCLRWSILHPLEPNRRYRPAEGTLRDRWGRIAVAPRVRGWFQTSGGPDRDPPNPDKVGARRSGPCFEARYGGDERVGLRLELRGRTTRANGFHPWVALRVVDEDLSGEATAHITVTDLADNETVIEPVVSTPEAGPGVEPIAITELLADAPGPEPHQEFVELAVLEDRAHDAHDLWLTDLSWAEVVRAIAAGEDPPGDPLPALTLQKGVVFVVVGPGYVPGPDEAGRRIRLDSSLGESGLKNAGEPVVLYGVDPLRLVSSYGNHISTARGHEGRSVVRADPWACDVPQAWGSHPTGTSNPGVLP